MTKKHLQFCIYYMQVGDPLVAYKMTYPRAAVKSLPASVSRLMARPEVAEWVNGTEERVHNRMMRKFHNEHYDKFKDQLLTINQKRTVLTKIITGETKRVRYVQAKYGLQKIEEPLPVYAVLRAVDLDTRLENFYNYLTRSDTWRKTQNIYVNTPTLQQQVNILINQTTEKEENKEAPVEIEVPKRPSPPGRGVPGHSADGGWVRSREEISPFKEVAHERVPEDVNSPKTLAPNTHESQTMSPLQGDRGTFAQNTRDAVNTSPRPNTETPTQHIPSGPGAISRDANNPNPHSNTETPTQQLPLGPGQSRAGRTTTNPPLGGVRRAHPRKVTKTPHYLKNGPTTPLTKLNKTQERYPANTSGKTPPGFNHPPRKSSS
ncbi:MAG: hypothetical protein K8F30_02625 [Taibaiella sp.]|nr:hypothetical protein [Taibaiella sp.]